MVYEPYAFPNREQDEHYLTIVFAQELCFTCQINPYKLIDWIRTFVIETNNKGSN